MTYRSRRMLDLAHAMQSCQVQTPACIGASPDGLEPAHGNWQWLGRGIGHKSTDAVFAACCRPCHQAIDSGATLTRAEKEMYWMRGAVRTWRWLMEAGLIAPTGAKTVDIVR